MRIATWNLDSSRRLDPDRERAFRDAMRAIAADVWVFTEPHPGLAPGDGYRMVAESSEAPDLPAGSGRRWVAIWSRVDARLLEVQSDPERLACVRVEQPGQRDVVVVGTVLPWRSDQRRAPVTGGAAFCHVLQSQAAEWVRLWGCPRACAFCVAGDFNQELVAPLKAGTEAGHSVLHATLQQLGLTCLTANLVAEKTGTPAIDHVCVAGGLPPALMPQAQTWPIPRSGDPPERVTDHSGAYADLAITAWPC